MSEPSKPAALYIHIPFCPTGCSFCHFYLPWEKKSRYVDLLKQEFALRFGQVKLKVQSIHIGGGTPNMLSVAELTALFAWISECTQDVSEFSIELHPALLSYALLDCLKIGGVNRISFGIQAVDPKILAEHTRVKLWYEDLGDYIQYARKIGIKHINFDFIYDLIGDSLEHIAAVGAYIAEHRPTSVNYYPLRVLTQYIEERYTINNKRRLAYYLAIKNLFADLGYSRKNNTIYVDLAQSTLINFKYEDIIYAHEHELYGLWVAATSHSWESFIKNSINYKKYREYIEDNISPVELSFELSHASRLAHDFYYYIFMYPNITMGDLWERFKDQMIEPFISNLITGGFIKVVGERVSFTEKGYFYTEEIEEILMWENSADLALLRKL